MQNISIVQKQDKLYHIRKHLPDLPIMSSIEYLPENVFIQCDNISLDISHNGKNKVSPISPISPIALIHHPTYPWTCITTERGTNQPSKNVLIIQFHHSLWTNILLNISHKSMSDRFTNFINSIPGMKNIQPEASIPVYLHTISHNEVKICQSHSHPPPQVWKTSIPRLLTSLALPHISMSATTYSATCPRFWNLTFYLNLKF